MIIAYKPAPRMPKNTVGPSGKQYLTGTTTFLLNACRFDVRIQVLYQLGLCREQVKKSLHVGMVYPLGLYSQSVKRHVILGTKYVHRPTYILTPPGTREELGQPDLLRVSLLV